jgi:hypothetical protein
LRRPIMSYRVACSACHGETMLVGLGVPTTDYDLKTFVVTRHHERRHSVANVRAKSVAAWCTRKSAIQRAVSKICGDAPGGMTLGSNWGQGMHIVLEVWGSNPPSIQGSGAGGTGIAPATCGFGACCRSFRDVQGSTQRGWKWAILTVESAWKFTRVHRRWGQIWDQTSAIEHSSFAWMPHNGAVQSQPLAAKWWTSPPPVE